MKRKISQQLCAQCCAERTRAMQRGCMCANVNTCTVLFTKVLCLERYEVQV